MHEIVISVSKIEGYNKSLMEVKTFHCKIEAMAYLDRLKDEKKPYRVESAVNNEKQR